MSVEHEERAKKALSDHIAFCQLLAEARQYQVPGWWDGSAFRSHPCGLVEGTVKLTNHWHVDNLATIYITDGEGWDLDVCKDSRAHGNPDPQPIKGKPFQVWYCGKWVNDMVRLQVEPRALAILSRAAEQIAQAKAKAQAAADERKREMDRLEVEAFQQALDKAAVVS